MLARKPLYTIGQQRNPGHPLKQNGQVKQPEYDATSIACSSCHAMMLPTHLLIVDVLSCSNMGWGMTMNPWYMRAPFVYSG
jgi:hypothetical protein